MDSGYLDKLIETLKDKISKQFSDEIFDGDKSDYSGWEERLKELEEAKKGNYL
jgi:hypothetical protein